MSTPGLTRALRPCGSGLLFVGKTSARFTAHDHQLDSSRQTRFTADQNLLNTTEKDFTPTQVLWLEGIQT